MNQQKRHLTVMSIIIALTLAVLSYGGQTGGRQASVADSHDDAYICSHNNRTDPGTSLAARSMIAAKGGDADGSLRMMGGQIG